MQETGIDAWVTPAATGTAPEGLSTTGDPIMNIPWTHSGVPTITLSSGTNEAGLPYGMQFAAMFGADEKLLVWAEDWAVAVKG